jgi:hypothetical protein
MSVLAFIPTHNDGQKWVISVVVDENCALLGYHAPCIGNSLPTFRDNLSVPSSWLKNPKDILKMGPTRCPKTSVRNYDYLLRNNTERTELSVSTLRGSDILGYDVLWFVKIFPPFQRNLSPPFSGSMQFTNTIVNGYWLREQKVHSE